MKRNIVYIGGVIVCLLIILYSGIRNWNDDTHHVETPVVEEAPAETSAPLYGQEIIGHSVQGRPVEVYTFGTGEKDILFVGGVHGGPLTRCACVS